MNNIHREGNVQDGDTVRNLDRIDADLDGRDVDFVKCSRKGVEKSYGVGSLPALVHFSDGIPVLFHGDLGEYDEVLEWILGNLEVGYVCQKRLDLTAHATERYFLFHFRHF